MLGAPACQRYGPSCLFTGETVSGEQRDQWGSLIELTWYGRDPIDGRSFLADGDEAVISARRQRTATR
jgi:hypothetical protein